ncbi:MAG: EAL domain-containing protein [Gammaproteobacteria bacterium]|nr:EAL domain-containing protein [Gammaproteobacteria bacterium]
MHLLIIGDQPEETGHIRTALGENGFANITVASSDDEAHACLRRSIKNGKSDIDAILLDTLSPDTGGCELCDMLGAHKEWSDIPVIILVDSCVAEDETIRALLSAGATDILFKPMRGTELLSRIIACFSLKRERDLRKAREHELETELAERKVVEARLQYLVGHDDLTGLCNRRRLEQELELTVLNAHYNNTTSALFYLDLDQFKIVNDTEGHAVGDRLLVSVANRLRRQIGASGTLARISSDEYAVLIENITSNDAIRTAESLRCLMEEFHFKTNNKTYHIGASIGVTIIYPNETISASEALTRADRACYVAKARGRNMVHVFNSDDIEMLPLRHAVEWVPLIRDALANDKFRLVFQPVLNLLSQEINHYEALIRMVGADQELISPHNFIPVAERMGLIHDIDLWVVENAIDILKRQPVYISVNINLSGHAFQDPALLPLIRDKLAATGVKAERITFEITETAAIANFSQTRNMIDELRKLGCRFALDDFGAGFNSFSYLKELPVDYLKIDGAFITNLVNDPVDQALVKSMTEVARTLGKHTVAEFVENSETLSLLKEYGVDYAQGYYIGRPESLDLAS